MFVAGPAKLTKMLMKKRWKATVKLIETKLLMAYY